MTVSWHTLAVVLAAALLTWGTRVGGVWLVRRVPLGGRAAATLDAVPGSMLAALVAPALASPADWVAAVLTFLLARRLPAVVAIALGIACAVVLRQFTQGSV